ncbi:Ras and EF-hand domain-containing protein [Liparis tanakae]|uniref:Ras and EF-hand domain-containing protein n=1 Tax=Liparis tanakae TaxID=230148 RepID=A0A4Z2E463_9TELE|nr:Ras and EF-hand domain-containing protein [Liparis tanakae]
MLCRINPVSHRISSQENEDLRTSLLQAQTDIAVLHSELDKLKNMYADQKAQHKRETNKKLYDSNDGLRSALASEAVAAKRRVSPLFADDIFAHTYWI